MLSMPAVYLREAEAQRAVFGDDKVRFGVLGPPTGEIPTEQLAGIAFATSSLGERLIARIAVGISFVGLAIILLHFSRRLGTLIARGLEPS